MALLFPAYLKTILSRMCCSMSKDFVILLTALSRLKTYRLATYWLESLFDALGALVLMHVHLRLWKSGFRSDCQLT